MFGLLRVLNGPEEGQLFSLQEGQRVKVGRNRSNQLFLSDPYVAREHCEIAFEKGEVWLLDRASTNTTLVNEQAVTRHQLQSGDLIQIGKTTLSFRWSNEDQQSTLSSGELALGGDSSP
jgi:pSer/pThr/pTyr-binding forkhead associated (FHA) protein